MRLSIGNFGRALITAMSVCLLWTSIATAQTTAPARVRIGVLAPRGEDAANRLWSPTAAHLSRQLSDCQFSIVPLAYKSITAAVQRGEVEFVITNPANYVELEASAGATRILTMETVRDGVPCHEFGGVIFARAVRGDLTTLSDLRGMRFIAVERNSFGGWIAARRELQQQGVVVSNFASLSFAGGMNDNVVYAVRDGRADAGCVRTDHLETMAAEGLINLADFKVLNAQPPSPQCPSFRSTALYPEWAFATLHSTPASLARRVVVALLSVPPDLSATRTSQVTGWTSPQDYSSVHECLRELRLPPYDKPEPALTARMAASRLRYWLIAAGLVIVLIVGLLLYLARLSLRLGTRAIDMRDTRGCVTHVVRNMRRAARMAAVFLVVVPSFVLLGWALRSPAMVAILPGLVAMNPVVAMSFLSLGAALWWMQGTSIRAHRLAGGIGIAVALLAGIKLAGMVVGVETFVDQLLFSGRLDLLPGLPPNRMAPNTAICLLLLGAAMATLDRPTRKGRRPAQVLAILAGLIAVLALVGYLYSVTSLYHVTTFIPMALHTAASVVMLSLGLLFTRPDCGMMAIVSSDTVGGVTARRLLPATILVPVALGWLRVLAQRLGLNDVDFGVSLVILVDIAFFALLVWTTAGLLRRSDLQRQETDAALGRERNLLRSLIDNLPDHIFIKDAAGRYIADNVSHARFVGLRSPEEVVGKTVADFFPPQLAEKFAADDQAVIASGKPLLAREEPIAEKDGSRRWVSTTKVPVRDDQDQPAGLVCISRDITEQVIAQQQLREQYAKVQDLARSEHEAHDTLKRAQSQMVQSEKLAGLGQLVAGVAHEINNPLSFVSNNVAVLQRDVAAIRKLLQMYQEADPIVQSGNAELMENIKDLCERMDLQYTLTNLDEMMVRSRDGLKRIQQIVKDLRDFARLDESDLHEVDLNQGVDSTVNIIRGRAKSKQVTIDLELQPLPPVACFPAKVNQVIMNLVANAIDASSANGKITIRTSAVPGSVNGGGVRIVVEDTGTGIPASVRERIFDPFFTTKKQGEGTGLGLSISYGIVHDHGGTIEVDSTPGQGSKFTVTLPLRPVVPVNRSRN